MPQNGENREEAKGALPQEPAVPATVPGERPESVTLAWPVMRRQRTSPCGGEGKAQGATR